MPAPLVPELYCSDIARSLEFYTGALGFRVLYDRPEERFAYLEREGAELMLEQPIRRSLLAGELVALYGRGVNFQVLVSDAQGLRDAIMQAGIPLKLDLEEAWYRRGELFLGNRQFVVQDPDGYLLRFFEDLGVRAYAPERPEFPPVS